MIHRITLCLAGLLIPVTGFGQTSAGSPAQDPIAVVDGQPIYELDLLKVAGPQLAQLRSQEHQLKSRALDELIRRKLLENEAKKRGVSAEALLAKEVEAKVPEPSDAEIEAFYVAQQDRINRPLNDVRPQIAAALKRAKTERAREAFAESLRSKADVSVFLRSPRTQVSIDSSRLRGDPNAPVTIVEFSDFECPFCTRVQPALTEMLAKYKGRVRLAYRDFPLREIHPKAQSAAEAARCAGEQGKFWEYHDALFADRSKLDAPGLAENAKKVGLDVTSFNSCLSSGKFTAKIEQDVQDGAKAGVSGTPAFFVNGVFLNGAQPASEFEKVIEAELAIAGGRRGAH